MSLNDSLKDFPTHQASVAAALFLILATGIVVMVRLAIGQTFPQNYDTWIWALIALAGVNVAGLGVKRFSDYGLAAVKSGQGIQDVAAAQQIKDTGTFPVPVPTPEVPKPSALAQRLASTSGEHPVEPSIRDALKDYADKQKEAAADKDDEGII